SISGTAYCASPGKLVYSLEETCLVEVETSSTLSTGETDIKLKTYATTTSNQNLVLDKDDVAKTCDVLGSDEYDMCWPAASGDCPATISMVLNPGIYQMYPVITSFTRFAVTSTTQVTGGLRKIKCADCTNTSSFNYCDLCSHCGDGVQNCGEMCIDGGGSCVSGTESTLEYAPYYEIGFDENNNMDYYELSNLELFFSTSFFCHDGIDNDYDCAFDMDDSDCLFVPSTCIDADGDGRGLGCVEFDCDDTDPTMWINCDTTPPQVNITINDYAIYTNNIDVTLNLDYFDDLTPKTSLKCAFSNDSVTYGVFDICDETTPWVLSGADGTKTVYVQVKDIYGNINNTENDSIILDMTAPSIVVDIDTNPTPSFENVSFIVNCNDGLSGCNVTTIFTSFDSCSIDYTIGETECAIKLPVECETRNYNYGINTTDIAGNLIYTNGTIVVKKREGCGCVVSDDCFSGMCLGASICAKLESPELSIVGDSETIQMSLGETKTIYLSVKNPLDMSDIIEFDIYGDPVQIRYWSYFEGHEYSNRTHKVVSVEANSELLIPINIFGGKAGSNKLIVEAKSNMNGLKTRKDVDVLIYQIDDKGNVVSRSPGLGFYGLLVVLLFAAVMFVRKK
ncbi:hypothetical protein GQ473_07000, partial [archaeon]|nr:hypothetical protein [archaeon]